MRGRRDVKPLQQSGSAAGAESPWQVPIPTRVRRRKSSRLLRLNFLPRTALHPQLPLRTHNQATVQTAFAQPGRRTIAMT